MNQKEEELYELPKWVKLVNSVLHGTKKPRDEKPDFENDRGFCAEDD